jgi:MoxR-like ATPase
VTYATYHGDRTPFYLTTEEIADIVNLAIRLQRPLLVEGEAGCGKTLLAWSIAHELGLPEPIVIPVKSTSQARDLLYRFDALRRLQDAQRRDVGALARARHVHPYVDLQPLGQAILQGGPSVILIDEVDKADIDFPNDLLDVLGQFTFEVDSLPAEESELCRAAKGFGRSVRTPPDRPRPVVVVTSNREKQLPEPFLRRCLYIRLRFPESIDELRDIVRKNTKLTNQELSEAVLGAAIQSFLAVRQTAVGNTQKPPSTGELIDWVRILHWKKATEESLTESPALPPYWETLFKTMGDLDTYPGLAQRRQS